ncbi:pif3 [Peridroma alphabaculovirus]|uniref:Pif3 n=1 Tax=Peridroma alphabaculovirus TaxID=1346829 RepID=A0A068LKX5_9ABAC|nr:pif3 [Peridroma alphabaculovirus]AIE47828.1 pif3 [Peridroma alphabaculovirus]
MTSSSSASSVLGVVVVLIVLFIICYYVIAALRELNAADEARVAAAAASAPMDLVFDRNGIVDCTHTRLPCVTDRQCTDNCAVQNAVGALVCDHGFCANRDPSVTGRPDDFHCDIALGLVKVYVASEFVVDQVCISTYRDIVDDLGEPRPYICDGGALDIDLVNRPFSVADCSCADGYTKMLFNQTALARSVPVCIPSRADAVYRRVYDVV